MLDADLDHLTEVLLPIVKLFFFFVIIHTLYYLE